MKLKISTNELKPSDRMENCTFTALSPFPTMFSTQSDNFILIRAYV